MQLNRCGVWALFLMLFATAGAIAQTTQNSQAGQFVPITLKIGNPAPALKVAKWIKGEPVTQFEKGRIYVVEFWASWSEASRSAVSQLSAMQKEYKDVVFIGLNCWEKSPGAATKFVAEMGDKLTYRVALDDGDQGTASTAWLRAAGRKDLPVAFVVGKDTSVLWIGPPTRLAEVMDNIVAGTFDPKREAMAADYLRRLGVLVQNNDDAKFEALCAEFAREMPERAGTVAHARFGMALRKNDYVAANRQATLYGEAMKDNAEALNAFAWLIINPEKPIPGVDHDVALKLALRAVEVSKGEQAAFLDTAARAYFLKGDVARAIELETSALAKETDPEEKKQLQATLDQYVAARK